MPELPEVETVAQSLRSTILNRRILGVYSLQNKRYNTLDAARGLLISSLTRRGKWLIFTLSQDYEIVVHLGMTGKILLQNPLEETSQHLKATLSLDNNLNLNFYDYRGFGKFLLLSKGDYHSLPGLQNLGPEITPSIDYSSKWIDLNRPIKAVLLDQNILCGIGNIYADESLFQSRIHPLQKHLSSPQALALYNNVYEQFSKAIALGGTSIRDYVDSRGNPGGNQKSLLVYGRKGLPCLNCSTPLQGLKVAGRTTTFCPSCQLLI